VFDSIKENRNRLRNDLGMVELVEGVEGVEGV